MKKKCSKCKKVKNQQDFYKSSKLPNGMSCYCKSCNDVYYTLRKKREKLSILEKECSICGIVKDRESFTIDSASKDGLRSCCKDCSHERRGNKKRFIKKDITITDIQASYLAGLTDGEGYIGLSKRKRKGRKDYYSARMCIALTNKVLYEIQNYTKLGKIQYVKSKNKSHKSRYDWWMSSNDCRALLPLILPYLMVKKQQAILLLEYLSLASHRNQTVEYKIKVEKIYNEIKKLNKRGV